MIERFIWTEHAEGRAAERGLSHIEVEAVVRDGHHVRVRNPGLGDWRVYGSRPDGERFAVVYDQPALAEEELARIITIWRLHNSLRH